MELIKGGAREPNQVRWREMETQAKSKGWRDWATPEEQKAVLKSVNDLPRQSHRDERGQSWKDDGPRWSRGSKEPR